MTVTRIKLVILPCLVFLAVTLPHLEQGDFRRDTGRYAAVGLYMWSEGSLWKPHFNPDTPYFNKPPLALLIHGAFLKVLGPHLAAARLPSILAGLGVVALTVLTVRRIGSRGEAIASGLVLALTYEFFRRSREISLDFWQLFFLVAAAYLVIQGAKTGRKRLVVLAGVPIGLGLLCKPFVALGALPVFAIWLVCLRRANWIGLLFVGTLPAAILVALPWHYGMWREYGSAFVDRYLGREVIDRARGRMQTNPPFYFVGLLATTYWPWALAAGFAVWRRVSNAAARRPPGRDLVVLGGVWCVLVLVLLSIFPDKKVNYALPLYPMLAWISGAGLCRLPWGWLRAWYRRGLPWLGPAAVLMLAVLSLAPIQFQKPPQPDWQRLFAWLNTGAVNPAKMTSLGLVHEDNCYYYLHTGHWLLPNRAAENRGLPVLILRKSETNSLTVPAGRELFRSGNLAVVQPEE